MEMLAEASKLGLLPDGTMPVIHCKAFEDNSGALEMVRLPKIRPRTRHINAKYHHFRSYYAKSKISIEFCPTEDMLADMLSKPQKRAIFLKQRAIVMGWKIGQVSFAKDDPTKD